MSPERRPDWQRLARERTAAHDLTGALDAWQQALALEPESLDTVMHLADLAFRLGQWDMAEKFCVHLITRGRRDTIIFKTYAASLREQGRFDEAGDFLKSVIPEHAGEAALWETLGSVLAARGDYATALVFFNEALRLDPDDLHARFLRGCALLDTGETQAGLKDVVACAEAFRDPDNRASAAITSAQACLSMGNLSDGWRWYEARHRRGTTREVAYELDLPRIPPDFRGKTGEAGGGLSGKRLFVSAEQGLGDEVLFGSLLPDIAAEVAALGIGVEPRLVPLFRRSFPHAEVVAHQTETRDGRLRRAFPDLDIGRYDAWALMGDFLRSKRAKIGDFPQRAAFLMPDPERVAYWRGYFSALGRQAKAGVLWKSLKMTGLRGLGFSPFSQWRDMLATPGVTFVSLQYGDAAEDLAAARAAGLDLHVPEGIDLKDDLDDLAALTCALDIVMGPSNATSNIAAACGAPVWMLTPPRNWLSLGQSFYPWYPSARLFPAPSAGDWQPALNGMHEALMSAFG